MFGLRNIMSKQNIIKIIISIIVLILIIFIPLKLKTGSTVRVLYSTEKIKSVKITLNTALGEYYSSKTLHKNVKNGKDYNLDHEDSLDEGEYYTIDYKGAGDYADGYLYIKSMKKHNIIEITPNYKDSVNDKLITKYKDSIYKALSNEFPNMHLYKIDKGGMLDDGRWYYTKLIYQGEDYSKSDTLRVVLEYKKDQWVIATKPDLILTQVNNPDIPFEVLSKANNYDVDVNF